MTYSVHFVADLGTISEEARREIERIMEEIAVVVSTIPPSNAFWASMDDSPLQIDLAGIKVVYRIHPRRQEIDVVGLERLRRP